MKRATKPKAWSDAEKQLLSKLARKGTSASEISVAIGRRISSVKKMARELKFVLKKTAAK
jgi:hypothetical protein